MRGDGAPRLLESRGWKARTCCVAVRWALHLLSCYYEIPISHLHLGEPSSSFPSSPPSLQCFVIVLTTAVSSCHVHIVGYCPLQHVTCLLSLACCPILPAVVCQSLDSLSSPSFPLPDLKSFILGGTFLGLLFQLYIFPSEFSSHCLRELCSTLPLCAECLFNLKINYYLTLALCSFQQVRTPLC